MFHVFLCMILACVADIIMRCIVASQLCPSWSAENKNSWQQISSPHIAHVLLQLIIFMAKNKGQKQRHEELFPKLLEDISKQREAMSQGALWHGERRFSDEYLSELAKLWNCECIYSILWLFDIYSKLMICFSYDNIEFQHSIHD